MKKILLNKWLLLACEIAFFIGIFLLSRIPLYDFDIWFHIKSGEIIAQKGIIHYDVFSYVTAGREWFPYEWLFQVIVYYWQQIFGLFTIPYMTAGMVTLMVLNIYFTVRKIFNLNRILSFVVCFIFIVSIYEFLSARPHIFAYTFLLINLNLILLYFIKNKNFLWISIPITLAWANLHGSIFLDVALFGAYAFLAFLNLITDEFRTFPRKFPHISAHKEWFKKFKNLSLYTFLTFVLTILPPLWLTQYRLLWIFYQNNSFISKYIDEWTPLVYDGFSFYFYSASFLLIVLLFIAIVVHYKKHKEAIWVIPLLIFPLSAYSASRNVFLGYITMVLMLGWIFSNIDFSKFTRTLKIVFAILVIGLVSFHIYILQDKMKPPNIRYPSQATQFIKDYQLKGHMYNEYGFGGYLLYNLYPQQKVFFDGRTDLYLCCEMRDTLDMATKKTESDSQYKKYLDWLWNKYDMSYIMLPTDKNSVQRKIGRILTADPANWTLVYWDDNTQIFVRHDGKNDNILKELGTTAATPWDKDPYKAGMDKQALFEYQRMEKVADSAKTRNAIGYIYLRQKKLDAAETQFEQAIKLDPTNESPYMNIAEIEAYNKNYDNAINLYLTAQKLAPDRGLIYIRLGQLYLASTGDTEKAKAIWQEGLTNTIDTQTKSQLQNLLSQY